MGGRLYRVFGCGFFEESRDKGGSTDSFKNHLSISSPHPFIPGYSHTPGGHLTLPLALPLGQLIFVRLFIAGAFLKQWNYYYFILLCKTSIYSSTDKASQVLIHSLSSPPARVFRNRAKFS